MYYERLRNKNVCITLPYGIGDTIKWKCPDDGKLHKSKIVGINIHIDKYSRGCVDTEYQVNIIFKGSLSKAYVKTNYIK